MGYPDGKRDMSLNAKKAYKIGLFTLSKIKKGDLSKHDFIYSIAFFKWLCRNEYIVPSEQHHTSASFRLTAFYSPKAIKYAVNSLRLDNLYSIFKGKETNESLIAKERIKYVRIAASCSIFGLKKGKDIVLDCVRYKKYLLYSLDSIIGTDSFSVCVVDEYDEIPNDWKNKNTCDILLNIIVKKKVSWTNVIGNKNHY